jgi:hypothetical protein
MKIRAIVFFLLIFGIIGYFRERFFEHLNIILAGVYRGTDEYSLLNLKMPAVMAPFSKMSYATLYYAKYGFTLIWAIVFYTISYFALRKLAANKNILKFLTWSYLLLLILAGISMAIGYFINSTLKNDEYTFSRWLLGITQSPIICLILLASEKLYSKSVKV